MSECSLLLYIVFNNIKKSGTMTTKFIKQMKKFYSTEWGITQYAVILTFLNIQLVLHQNWFVVKLFIIWNEYFWSKFCLIQKEIRDLDLKLHWNSIHFLSLAYFSLSWVYYCRNVCLFIEDFYETVSIYFYRIKLLSWEWSLFFLFCRYFLQ